MDGLERIFSLGPPRFWWQKFHKKAPLKNRGKTKGSENECSRTCSGGGKKPLAKKDKKRRSLDGKKKAGKQSQKNSAKTAKKKGERVPDLEKKDSGWNALGRKNRLVGRDTKTPWESHGSRRSGKTVPVGGEGGWKLGTAL